MVNNLINFVVLDWGFTRLKFWLVNFSGKILNEKSIFIKDLNNNPKFYDYKDLNNIANEISSFINYFSKDNCKKTYILSSCQMHCISGIFSDNKPFLSTWNDIPTILENTKLNNINGQPTLPSMPIHKIIKIKGCNYLKTESTLNIFQKEKIQIKKFLTPLQLIFNYYFNFNLQPSLHFWDSTCLPRNLILKKNNISDIGRLNSSLPTPKIISKSNLLVLPEVGDLVASTYSSLINSDMVINLGTGSQIIFKKSFQTIEIEYFRNYPFLGKVFVISHIPCGRLFSDYCNKTNIKFEELKECLNKFKIENFKNELKLSKKSLLYFPGYDAFRLKYISIPEININDIACFTKDRLITLWLLQYINLINYIFKNNNKEIHVNISICGELGGISLKAIKIFKEIFPSNFTFKLRVNSVPQSILSLSGIKK